jgi:intein/homing endonuclease
LILGYFFGDGNFTSGICKSNSISPSISFQIYLLLLKIGIKPKIRFIHKKNRWKGFLNSKDQYGIELDLVETNKLLSDLPEFIIDIYKNKDICIKYPTINRSSLRIDKNNTNCSRIIKNIEISQYSGNVYNLKIEDDNSYVVNGISVHNCDCLEQCFRISNRKQFKLLTLQPSGRE